MLDWRDDQHFVLGDTTFCAIAGDGSGKNPN